MALHIRTRVEPTQFLDKLHEKIQKGEIDTWIVDADGDFTHKPSQWFERAWLRGFANSPDGDVVFGIVGRKDVSMSKVVYAVYHGRFAEMLLIHFDDDIESIWTSSQVEEGFDFL